MCVCVRVCVCTPVPHVYLSGDELKWDEASEAALWSLVEKYKRELYDQKNGFTRNEYLDKIARELCMCMAKLFTDTDIQIPTLVHVLVLLLSVLKFVVLCLVFFQSPS